MKRVIASAIAIGIVSAFLMINVLDEQYRNSNWISLLGFAVFWYGIFGSIMFSGIKSLRKQSV